MAQNKYLFFKLEIFNNKMTKHITILLLLLSQLTLAQSQEHQEKFRQLEPDLWLGIWDKIHSSNSIKIDTLSYDDIPKSLDFRGTVVEALRWTDTNGVNLLIQTVTGQFNWKDYDENSLDYTLQDKSELYAYLFQKNDTDKEYQKVWRVYDYTECFGVDWFTGFIPKATTITDVDQDGVAEVSLPYVLICRGGVDPGVMKIIMYEGGTKYALRGSTMLMCDSDLSFGGEYKPSENLKNNKIFLDFLHQHWERNKCERGRFY